MFAYILRRILYAVPIVVCVMLLTFVLFFVANDADVIAARSLGGKNVTPEAVENWKREHGYNLPPVYNSGSPLLKKGDLLNWRAFVARLKPSVPSAPAAPAAPAGRPPARAAKKTAGEEKKEAASRKKPLPQRISLVKTAGQRRAAAAAAVGKRLREFLSAGLLKKLAKLSPRRSPTETEKEVLLKELNVGLTRRDFYDPVAWRGAELSKEAAALLKKGPASLSDGELRRFNRLLVEAAFPEAIAKAPKIEGWAHFTETLFFKKNAPLLWFDFGRADGMDLDIGREIKKRMWASLCLTVPITLFGVFFGLILSMLVAYVRGTYFDGLALLLCVIGMSISILYYIIGGQVIAGVWLKLAPISGFAYGLSGWRFLMMPIAIAVVGGLGGSIRFYRTVFLEELGRDYIRTARAKGLGEGRVLFSHALRNSLIPVITSVVVGLPLLFFGSLLLESFFAIPGLGSFLFDAIANADLSVIRAMVYLGSVLYIVGLILTDVCYAWADPRVRLQ